MVGMILCFSVVARINLAYGGGSSRVLRKALKACCDNDAEKVGKFAKAWGYESTETDWRKLVARDDIDLIDVTVPNVLHHDIVIAAAEAMVRS